MTQRKVLAGSAAVALILGSVLAGCTTTKPQPQSGGATLGETYQRVPGKAISFAPRIIQTAPKNTRPRQPSTSQAPIPMINSRPAVGPTRWLSIRNYCTLAPAYRHCLRYIASEPPATEAVVIFAPGSMVNEPQYLFPVSPVLYFFEGGAYRNLGFETVSGDAFIGGSAPGYPEPIFDDSGETGSGGGSISLQNDTYGPFLGGSSTLATKVAARATSITLTSPSRSTLSTLISPTARATM